MSMHQPDCGESCTDGRVEGLRFLEDHQEEVALRIAAGLVGLQKSDVRDVLGYPSHTDLIVGITGSSVEVEMFGRLVIRLMDGIVQDVSWR